VQEAELTVQILPLEEHLQMFPNALDVFSPLLFEDCFHETADLALFL